VPAAGRPAANSSGSRQQDHPPLPRGAQASARTRRSGVSAGAAYSQRHQAYERRTMCGAELRGAEPGVLRVARTTWAAKLPLTSARNRPQKCPRSPKFSPCPRPPSGPRPRTSAPSWRISAWRTVRPKTPFRVADSLPPAARIRRSPLCSRPPGKARRARLCGRIGTSGFLPVFWPSARGERGCPSAFAVVVRSISFEFAADPYRDGPGRSDCESQRR
jgi:hypothetical protein